MSDFLLEIGMDEIPARMIAGAEAELGRRILDLLTRERLLAPGAAVTTFSTPRRLAVLTTGVLPRQADTEEQMTGPSWKVAFKDGAPTPAAAAFAKKAGVEVSALQKVTTPKGEYVGATVKLHGRAAAEILSTDLPREVLGLYWAKNMYWRAGKPERFVRPVRWVVALLDSAVVPVEIAGIAAGNASRGHRVLHGDAPVVVAAPSEYVETLRAAYVAVDVAERRQSIREALDKATRTVPGARWREDEPLVETVLHLTEWPSVILGNFDPEHLALPEEVLVTVMRDHQKYFAVELADEKQAQFQMGDAPYYRRLLPHFLTVLNTTVDEEGASIIRHGNQKVLVARFKDARFFWDFDQKVQLAERAENLKTVTFQKELGSYFWKTEQNLKIIEILAARTPKTLTGYSVDVESLRLATKLAKTDLTTELVKEFTELQGYVGGQYALAQGMSGVVAQAINDQYKPASMDDRTPMTPEGQLLGLADRIQTITAMFGIGLEPTGSKDPFALRRAANAIVKILAESELSLTIGDVVSAGTSVFEELGRQGEKPNFSRLSGAAIGFEDGQTLRFLRERLHFYLKDVRNFAYDVVNATLAAGADDVRDAIARAQALTAARESADFAAISAAFKRIKNILRQAEEKKYAIGSPASVKLAPEAAQLAEAASALAPRVAALREQRDYGEALALIATLRPAVDTFFDKVMVLDPDEAVRGANLGLISEVLSSFSGIADFSEIVTA